MLLTRTALIAFLVAGCAPEIAERRPVEDPSSAAAAEAPLPPPSTLNQPDPILAEAPSPDTSRAARTFTCPMHPAVRARVAGVCPICGMTLAPVDR